jgi:hypothetical protein
MSPSLLTSSPSTSFLSPLPFKLTPSSLTLPKRHRFRVSYPRSSAAEYPSAITLESKPDDLFGGKRELSGAQSIVSNLSPTLRLASSALILAGALAAGYGLGTKFGGGSRNLALGGGAVAGAAVGAVVFSLNSAVPEIAAINLHNYVSGFDDPTKVSKEEIEGIAKKSVTLILFWFNC